ncbi:MAG: hypothetical protein LBT88_03615 [Oscillospiraceae bacterium]|jgi:hypothetical protein|nr:hypothetical protein [Oscillospiraceae bacterium]
MTNSQQITESIMRVISTIQRITRYGKYCNNKKSKQYIDDMLSASLDTALKLPDMIANLRCLVYQEKCTYSDWCADIDKYLVDVYGKVKDGNSWLTLLRNDTFHNDITENADNIDERIKIAEDYLCITLSDVAGTHQSTVIIRGKYIVIYLLIQKAYQDLYLCNVKKMEKQCGQCFQTFESKYKNKSSCMGQQTNEHGEHNCKRFENREWKYNITKCPLDHTCFSCTAEASISNRKKPQALLAKYIGEDTSGEYYCIDNRRREDNEIFASIDSAWSEFNALFEREKI